MFFRKIESKIESFLKAEQKKVLLIDGAKGQLNMFSLLQNQIFKPSNL